MAGTPTARGSRRQFLGCAAAAWGLPLATVPDWLTQAAAQAPCETAPAGEFVRTLPLYGPGARDIPLGQVVGGSGLDARLFTDLSALDETSLITPAAAMFVRTAAPRALPAATSGWTIALGADGTPRTEAARLG